MSDPTETKRASWYGPEGTTDPRTYGLMHGLTDYAEVAIIKYLTRWRKPGGGGLKALLKAKFWLDKLIEEERAGANRAADRYVEPE